MALKTVTYKCEAGHIVTVGEWCRTAPLCALCKITDETVRIAGYIPKFESNRWEIAALTFNAYCERGHLYEASVAGTAPCTVCRRIAHLDEDSGFAPTLVANYSKYTKFRCHAGHLFMADDRTTGCPGCRCAETIKASGRSVSIASTDAVFWGRGTYVKFACAECRGTFYANQDEIKSAGPHVLACPHDASAVSRTVKMLESYYSAAFDDTEMIADGIMIRVCGYNRARRTAVVHTAGFSVDAATENWCQKNNVRLFKVGATTTADIEKTLARQISESEGADLADVLDRMHARAHVHAHAHVH